MQHVDLQPLSAGTAVLSSPASGSRAALPKTVVIPDLHRVAMARGGVRTLCQKVGSKNGKTLIDLAKQSNMSWVHDVHAHHPWAFVGKQ